MAKKDNAKKLTPAVLKKQDKRLDEKGTFTIEIDGEEFELTHDLIFRKSKNHKVLDDLVLFFEECGKNRLQALELATPYIALLAIKHFTSLEVSDDIDEALDMLNVLIDLEVLDKIVNSLPEEEISKLFELLTQTLDNFRDELDRTRQEAEQLALENADILGIETDTDGEENDTEGA